MQRNVNSVACSSALFERNAFTGNVGQILAGLQCRVAVKKETNNNMCIDCSKKKKPTTTMYIDSSHKKKKNNRKRKTANAAMPNLGSGCPRRHLRHSSCTSHSSTVRCSLQSLCTSHCAHESGWRANSRPRSARRKRRSCSLQKIKIATRRQQSS